jgi:hypothetical protein
MSVQTFFPKDFWIPVTNLCDNPFLYEVSNLFVSLVGLRNQATGSRATVEHTYLVDPSVPSGFHRWKERLNEINGLTSFAQFAMESRG